MNGQGERCAQYLESLERLVTLSERMVGLARDGQWDAVAETQVQRQELLASLGDVGALGLAEDDKRVQLIRERLRAMLELDAQVMGLGHQAREALSGRIHTFAEGRSARRAYLENNG